MHCFRSFSTRALTVAMALSFSISSAYARNPSMPLTESENADLYNASASELLLNKISSMSAKELEEFLSVKNVKGERVQQNRASTVPTLWSQLDPFRNQIEGTSTALVYQNYSIQPAANQIIVAVIDSGIDVNHEDLRGKIWINPGEIPGDGIDNDGDGYIDDVNGWNFLGGKDAQGNNVDVDGSTLECTRELARLHKLEQSGHVLTAAEQAYRTDLQAVYDQGREETEDAITTYQIYAAAYALLKANGLRTETVAAVNAIRETSADITSAKGLVKYLLARNITSASVNATLSDKGDELAYAYNFGYDPSALIVHDHPNDMNEKFYGNNDVTGPDAKHGTHVAGIIGANRLNAMGILGQAENVKIMVLRAVPNGDERDKDVANAIRFAVDHGAQVINMSFGKQFSPGKSTVDEAVKYAEAKGVLLVHAAGNDSKNTESLMNNYPNSRLKNANGSIRSATNWIEVGASAPLKDFNPATGDTLPASFSNWGKTSVDLFAPGTSILSSTPGNKYETLQGTSMACPEVAGVAALLLDRHPELSFKAAQLKNLLMSNVTTYPGLDVIVPGTLKNVAARGARARYDGQHKLFSDLSISGGVVNAFKAMNTLEGNR